MKLRVLLTVTSLTATVGLVSAAHAQEAMPPPLLGPSLFPTMGADGSSSQAGVQLGFQKGEGNGSALKRLDLNAQFVAPTGFGGYATIAGTHVEDITHIGSLEVGGLWTRPLTNGHLVLRFGAVLPTSRETEDDSEFVHLIGTLFARPSDLVTSAPETTTLRFAASPSFRSGNFVARADVGFDIIVDSPGEETPDPLLHLDLGGGFDNGKGVAVAELTTMMSLEETDDTFHVLAFTGGFHTGQVTPYLTLSLPFGDFFGEELGDITNVMFGVRGRL